jgi:long-chain fatty acid transport protein
VLRKLLPFLMSSVAVVGLTAEAHAGAFFIPQQGASGVGRAFAGGSAAANDATTIFNNPAGMTELKGAEVQLGISTIVPDIKLENRGSTAATPTTLGASLPYPGNVGQEPSNVSPIPSIFAAVPLLDNQLWIGVGVTAPFGLGLKYDPSWFGRYDSTSIRLATIDFQPSFAYRVNKWISIGGGLDIQYAKAKLTQALPNPFVGVPTAATDGASTLRGDSWAIGGNFGVLIKPSEDTRIGLHYRSRMTQDIEGTAVLQLPGLLAAGSGEFPISTDVKLPDIYSLGVAHQLNSQLTLYAEFQYFNWSRFNELRVRFDPFILPDSVRAENYRDTVGVSVGADYALTQNLTIRGGFMYDQTPTRDGFRATTVPDSNRYWIAAGASYNFDDAWSIDLNYAHTFMESEDINVTRTFYDGTVAASSTNVRARVKPSFDTFAFAVKRRF